MTVSFQVLIPNVETTYWCSAYRLPVSFSTQTFYVTKVTTTSLFSNDHTAIYEHYFSPSSQQFSPIISPGNAPYVHHLLVYVCDSLDGVDLSNQGPCDSGDRRIRLCLNELLIGAWAVGGDVRGLFSWSIGAIYSLKLSGVCLSWQYCLRHRRTWVSTICCHADTLQQPRTSNRFVWTHIQRNLGDEHRLARYLMYI